MLTTTTHPAASIDNQIDTITVNATTLLRDLLECIHSLPEIAAAHKLTLLQLIVWCDQPAVRALLDAADALARRIAAHKAAAGRPAAVQLLSEHVLSLSETPRDRAQANHAARAIIRASAPSHAPRRRRSAAAASRIPVYPFRPDVRSNGYHDPPDKMEPFVKVPKVLEEGGGA